jgi:threonine dehydratase
VIAGTSANAAKIDRIRQLGAAVELVAGDIENPRERAREIAAHSNAFLVEDSENLDTCEGAGAIGLELLDGFNRIDAILLALGGRALATGVGHVFKTLSPATEVVCVQPRGTPAMAMSWRAQSIVTTDRTDTIAAGVAGRFPIPAVLVDLLAIADHVPLVGRPRRRGYPGRALALPRQARDRGDVRFECPIRFIQRMDARVGQGFIRVHQVLIETGV